MSAPPADTRQLAGSMEDTARAAAPLPSPVRRAVPMLVWQFALGIAVLLAWQGASGRLIDNFFISNPIDVSIRLYRWIADGSIFMHLGATVYATGMGFVIGSVGGAVLGVWLGVSPTASRLLNPYLNALNALPKGALERSLGLSEDE